MHEAGRNEERARGRVNKLAAEGEVAGEAIASWVEARRDFARQLRGLPIEEAQRQLGLELQKIEAQVGRLEEGGHADREAALSNAVELGQRLRWVLWLGDVVAGELTVDPLPLLEQELDRATLRCTELVRIDPDRREEAGLIVGVIDGERRSILHLRLARFVADLVETPQGSALETATTSWRVVAESFQLEVRVLELGEVKEPSGAAHVEPRIEELYRGRSAHLDRCRSALESLTLQEIGTFAHVAISELTDEIGSRLTEGGDVPSDARLGVLELLKQHIGVLQELVEPWRSGLLRKGELTDDERQRFLRDLRQLVRCRRLTAVTENETQTRGRLEGFFGARKVRVVEGLVTFLVFLFLGLVVAEWFVEPQQAYVLHLVDLGFCVVFQIDFFVRWGFSRWNGGYFLRHFWLESLPALPFGLMLPSVEHAQALSGVRGLRLVRVLARFRGGVLLVVRVFRLFIFLSRGVDRLVERFRRLLDRDVLLFDPDPLGDSLESPVRRRTLTLDTRRQRFIRHTYLSMSWSDRAGFLPSHVAALGAEVSVAGSIGLPYRRAVTDARGEVHLERVIHNFLSCDVTRALSLVGRDGARRLTRLLRLFDMPGIRRLPVLRRVVPHARTPNPAEAVSAVANAIGEVLQEILGVLRFWGDLSGISTGPQILDRVATAVILATKRPAVRLILIGTLIGAAAGIAGLLGSERIERLFEPVYELFGLPVVVLGLVCLGFLMTGVWMKRIAGEALGQYLRTSDAQYYPLLKARKFLALRRDMESLYRSVLRPECAIRQAEAPDDDTAWVSFLADPFEARARFIPRSNRSADPRFAELTEDRDLIALLYRDFLDGPVLHRSDDKTSGQLLGDLTILEIRAQVLTQDGKSRRRLRKLDLDRGGALNLGPYFWFRFITESLAIETAKLIMEYNMACVPIDQRALASKESTRRFESFIAERRVVGEPSQQGGPGASTREFGGTLVTGSFTAFDFLGPSPQSDAAVRERYGDEVLACLQEDRRALVRDVFGTRPYHLLPRNRRVFNPYLLYRRYLGGAKIFFLPVTVVYGFVQLLASGVSQVLDLVREVRGSKRVSRGEQSRVAGFDVAVRKINRMRKPFFIEALNLRAALDVEYLGLRLPGQPRLDDCVTFAEDLDFIGALETERKPVQELRNRAIRDLRAFRLFLGEHGWGEDELEGVLDRLDPTGTLKTHRGEVVRALVAAYITDHDELRSVITAPDDVRAFTDLVLGGGRSGLVRTAIQGAFCGVFRFTARYRRRKKLFDDYRTWSPDLEELSKGAQAELRRELLLADPSVERAWELALRARGAARGVGESPVDEALERVAKSYSLWTRRLITVRTVQTLTVLDIRSYRDMVRDVGGYEAD